MYDNVNLRPGFFRRSILVDDLSSSYSPSIRYILSQKLTNKGFSNLTSV